jgi:uncharacterized protein YbaP (TraB family)
MRAALTALALVTSTLPAAADPAMWKITDADSTVWLFGSIHMLAADREWRTPLFDAALAQSELVHFELILAEAAPDMARIMWELGFAVDDRQLTDYFTPEQKLRWDAAVERLGIDSAAVQKMRPWFAALNLPGLGVGADASIGLDLDTGVEMTLQSELDDARERGLETIESQLRIIADLPDALQVEMLFEALEGDAAPTQAAVEELTVAWEGGDTVRVGEMIESDLGAPGSPLYDRLLADRNIRWVDAVAAMLAESTDQMVVVGAGHFVGPHGLPTLLKARGIRVERVQ